MTFTAGTHLGPYEIVDKVGAGGMGEVYRARDAKLHRDVAIKILPDLFASDPERVARFEREAQTLASLNHPHIAQIYGVIEDPLGLVMELVEGQDLAERVAAGPIPLEDAIPIARQIAEALEAAHERGIIHRDLKPANIKVTPDGLVKVLDFGLAKAVENAPGVPEFDVAGLANSPTVTSPVLRSRAGVMLGTAAYMAPEQARGKTVDKRADIWAFGCVLFEMLTGRCTFGRANLTDTFAAIVRDAPDTAALPASTPPHVRDLIERCLEKDPKERLRDIGEARIALARGLNAPVVTREVQATRRRPLVPLAWIAGGLVLGGAATASLLPRRADGPPLVESLRQLTQMPGAEINPDISPDGRQVLYAAGPKGRRHLFLLPRWRQPGHRSDVELRRRRRAGCVLAGRPAHRLPLRP